MNTSNWIDRVEIMQAMDGVEWLVMIGRRVLEQFVSHEGAAVMINRLRFEFNMRNGGGA
jgi:hypothetical protein